MKHTCTTLVGMKKCSKINATCKNAQEISSLVYYIFLSYHLVITLFNFITLFCRTDNIPHNILG